MESQVSLGKASDWRPHFFGTSGGPYAGGGPAAGYPISVANLVDVAAPRSITIITGGSPGGRQESRVGAGSTMHI